MKKSALPVVIASVFLVLAQARAEEAVPIDPVIVDTLFAAEAAESGSAPAGATRKDERNLQKLEDILRLTYAHNPSVLAARAGVRAVQEKMPQALSGWRPRISASGNITDSDVEGSNFGGSGTISKEVGAEFTQPLYRGGRTIAATDQASNLIMAQRALLMAREQEILRDVAAAYMDVSRDEALLELGDANRNVIRKQLEATKQRFEVGELTRTDVAQAEARLAAADAGYTKARGDLQKSRAVFEQITGIPAGVTGEPALRFPVPPDLENALAAAEKQNPEVAAAVFLHRASKGDVGIIYGELLPQLELFGSYDKAYDPQPGIISESTTRSIGVSASVPIYEGGMTRSRVREARHISNQRYLEIVDARRRIRQETVTHWETLKAAQANIKSRLAQVEAARLAQEGVHAESDAGARTILDALDADQEYLDAEVALVTAQRDEVVATFDLAASLGLLSPEILGFGDLRPDYDREMNQIMWKILGTDVDIQDSLIQ